jgi:N-acetylmuramoyl-L-alanine amidase
MHYPAAHLHNLRGLAQSSYVFGFSASNCIFVLRRAAMPSILVETHNALDPREAARREDPGTVDAFAAAVLAALGDWATARGR